MATLDRYFGRTLEGSHALEHGDVVIGSSAGARVVIDDRLVSPGHARAFRRDDGWWLEELNSRTGVWLDGARVERTPLREGTTVVVGRRSLVYRGGEEPSPLADVPSARLVWKGQAVPLTADLHAIGWARSCAVVLPGFSRLVKHAAELLCGPDGRWFLVAPHRRVPVRIGATPVKLRFLADGDTIVVGKHEVAFRLG